MPTTLNRDIAGRRYALAIMEIAGEGQSFARWAETLDAMAVLTSEPRFVNALQSDGMTDDKLQDVVRQVVPGVTPVEMNLFRLLKRKNRLALGPSIASYFHELWDEERGVERAVVRTAVPLDDPTRDRIQQQLSQQTGKTVEMETEVDPSLIGGAVIRIGDRLIDGSTRTRLRQLRGRLQQGAI
jgi:F-type H+-transporting ATPase subunit delta